MSRARVSAQALAPATIPDNPYVYRAKLARVVDGDTVWLDVDLGFRMIGHLEFRLVGIDTPETRGATKVAGEAAKRSLERTLKGRRLRVISEKSEKYGRWLGTIFYETPKGEWRDVSADMIRRKHAVAYNPR